MLEEKAMMASILGSNFSEPAPAVDPADAELLAREHFGVDAVAAPLNGERDRNFLLTESNSNQWVLKVIHPSEDPAVTDLQNQALRYLNNRVRGFAAPQVKLPLEGRDANAVWVDNSLVPPRRCQVRMYSFLPGLPMNLTDPTPALHRNLGTLLGEVVVALEGFRHPAESRQIVWDAQNVTKIWPLVRDRAECEPINSMLRHIEGHAMPRLPQLRAQVIHNDFNPDNILTKRNGDPDLVGVIDFGDLVYAPLVQDVATAAAYQVLDQGHPLLGPARVAKAFHAVCALSLEDIEVLFDLIVARLILRVTVAEIRAANDSANREYVLRNSAQATSALRRLSTIDCRTARDFLARAILD